MNDPIVPDPRDDGPLAGAAMLLPPSSDAATRSRVSGSVCTVVMVPTGRLPSSVGRLDVGPYVGSGVVEPTAPAGVRDHRVVLLREAGIDSHLRPDDPGGIDVEPHVIAATRSTERVETSIGDVAVDFGVETVETLEIGQAR